MTQDLIDCYRDCEKLMPLLHLPVQSGSDKILKLMNRKHDKKYYMEVIEKLKSVKKDIMISSDFIVGYPGETEQDFNDTIDLIRNVGFVNSYSFIFSPRPGTPAATEKQQNIGEVKKRLQKLQNILENYQCPPKNISVENNKKKLHQYCEVLVENKLNNQEKYFGRTKYMTPVIFDSNNCKPGDLTKVKINFFNLNNLFGSCDTNKEKVA